MITAVLLADFAVHTTGMMRNDAVGACRHPQTRRHAACAAMRPQAAQKYDYDLVIIGAGVGGHGAAMHAVESVSQDDTLRSRKSM